MLRRDVIRKVAIEGTQFLSRSARILGKAQILDIWAPTGKPTTHKMSSRIGDFTLRRLGQVLEFVQGRRAVKERLCVRVPRVGKYLLGRTFFHDAPQVHHGDSIGEKPNGRQIVRDVEERAVICLLNVLQQIQDLRPDTQIQGRGGLVANHQRRLKGKGSTDRNALPLTTTKLVRISVNKSRIEAHFFKDRCRIAALTGERQGLLDRLPYLPSRIEARIRVLPYHPHLLRHAPGGALHFHAIEMNMAVFQGL